jgi:ammonium transporter, Amt family
MKFVNFQFYGENSDMTLLSDPMRLAASRRLGGLVTGTAMALCSLAAPALAAAPVPNKGDTAWMLISTALVLLMTVPGLALFYGGLVRTKNMLSMLMQVFTIVCVVCLLWVLYGYSLAFTGGPWNDYVGGLSKAFLKGVTPDTLSSPNTSTSPSR